MSTTTITREQQADEGPALHPDGLLRSAARRWGRRPYLRFDGQVARTFEDLDEAADRVATGLLADGLEPHERVAVMADNRPEYLDAWFGIMRAGGIEVSINTAFRGAPLRYVLGQSGTRTAIVHAEYLEAVLAEREQLPELRRIWVLDAQPARSGDPLVRPFSELVRERDRVDAELDHRAVAMLGYTSGTTGRSKGVMLPHRRLAASAQDMVSIREITAEDVLYTPLPLFHGNAKILTALPAVAAGAELALGNRFSASGFWEEVRTCGATQLNYLGVMIAILNKAPRSPDDRDHAVRLAWGAGAPAQAMEAFESRFGIVLLEGYGLTECGVVLTSTRRDRRPGTCGRAVPGYQVALLDAHDEVIEGEGVGEIAVRPDRPFTTMVGYWGYPEETARAFRNCWVHTGDLGRRHDDGRFSFVDRAKDALRRRGENISSFEVEDILNQHPEVLESAVFAVRSEVTEDDVMARIVVQEGSTLTAAALHAFCEREMPSFWVPRYFDIGTSPLPRTPTNKVEKYKLVAAGVTDTTWDRERT